MASNDPIIHARVLPEVYELILEKGKGKSVSEKLRSIIYKGLGIEVEHSVETIKKSHTKITLIDE